MKDYEYSEFKPIRETKADGFRYNLSAISHSYLNYLLFNPEARDAAQKPDNFSVIQYINIDAMKRYIETSTEVYNRLARLPRTNTYLNLGMGAGFLERIVHLLGKINLESVEWEKQDVLFRPLRDHLDVNVNYICNSVYDDNFEIYGCNKTYDYILLIRFFPLNKKLSPELEKVKSILRKLKKYADKAILIDYYDNYEEDVRDFFHSIQDKPLPNSENFDNWILDLSRI